MRPTLIVLFLACALPGLPSTGTAGFLGDYGDAPEGFACYPSGVIGRFPSCEAITPAGSQTGECAAPGTAPGTTGFVRHYLQTPALRFWIGCRSPGFDVETDARVGPSGGASCGQVTTDCVASHPEWGGLAFRQDECIGDGVDAQTNPSPFSFVANEGMLSTLSVDVRNDGLPATAYLNVLIDMNADGDWNDVISDFSPCHPEWAVRNHVVSIPTGCVGVTSPPFQVTRSAHPASVIPSWVRITLSGTPAPDDFPWNGTASAADASLIGGETEDYPAVIVFSDPVTPTSWGRVKTIYR